MASRYPFTQRSKEAPMDYQWTNRSPVKPAWAAGVEEHTTPRKRAHDDVNPPTPLLTEQRQPTFGSNQNVPFLFQPTPVPQTPQSHPWAPPPQFSISKAFPTQNDVKDIDMTEASPFRNDETKGEESPVREKEADNSRPVASGALRRVFKQRTKHMYTRRRRAQEDEHGSSGSEGESEEEDIVAPLTKTSNHYTLNMPAHPAPQSDLPYILLGYLQFFFNLSLILIFLYLFVQFIVTVQKDVEHRILEYSQEIIQEISMCAVQYTNNRCAEPNPIPAMVQQCSNWETCMNRDPAIVGRAKVGAELIAEVVNGFVEPISWKTLIFTLTSLAFLTVFINTLLSLYRAKHHPVTQTAHHPAPSFPIAPSATPFPPHHLSYLSPAATPSWGRYRSEQDLESPTRRRRLEGGAATKIK
ncbi:Di-sulfide bridge nucleocytoplasmic transport domain-containing protein [Flammula alnicola]|nr:Di-sulfide bridge nucleocytoplasmic transport domain-containing protein [Flammula alnicola]